MNIARILYPVKVLGPGNRVGIWTCGCCHHCRGCSNPELWQQRDEYEIEVDVLVDAIKTTFAEKGIDGFVITGGDPFFQAEELSRLLPALRELSCDILVYTGFTYSELLASADTAVERCLDSISVLIDGRYVEELNDGSLLRGSSNQTILYLDHSAEKKYLEYFKEIGTNQIQNFTADNGIVSVGIHHPGFNRDITGEAMKKGVVVDGRDDG